jgi:hypothetical protein
VPGGAIVITWRSDVLSDRMEGLVKSPPSVKICNSPEAWMGGISCAKVRGAMQFIHNCYVSLVILTATSLRTPGAGLCQMPLAATSWTGSP